MAVWFPGTLRMSKPHITDLYFHDELSITIGVDAANAWYTSLCRRSLSRRMSSQRIDENRPHNIGVPRFLPHHPSSKNPSLATESLSRERLEAHLDGGVLSEPMTENPSSSHQNNKSINSKEENHDLLRSKFPNEGSKPQTRGLMYTDAAHTVFDRTDRGHPSVSKSK